MRTVHTDSLCYRCVEAFVAGGRVYCGAEGCFRSLHKNTLKCKSFSPKLEYAAITADLVEMAAGCERLTVCTVCEKSGNG